MRGVEFVGLDLDKVRFPQDERHLVVRDYRCVLATGLLLLEGDDSPDARALRIDLQRRLDFAGPNQEVGLFHLGDFGKYVPEDFAVEVLGHAQAACDEARK
jgi:hypothetical protein